MTLLSISRQSRLPFALIMLQRNEYNLYNGI